MQRHREPSSGQRRQAATGTSLHGALKLTEISIIFRRTTSKALNIYCDGTYMTLSANKGAQTILPIKMAYPGSLSLLSQPNRTTQSTRTSLSTYTSKLETRIRCRHQDPCTQARGFPSALRRM
jgi:hypothetical protein